MPISTNRLYYWVLLSCFVTLPFSLPLTQQGHQLLIPGEGLLLLSAILLAWQFPWQHWRSLFRTPLAWWGLAYITWQFIGTLWSVAPITTLKYALQEALYWWVCYVGLLYLWDGKALVIGDTLQVKKSNLESSIAIILAYGLSFGLIMCYAWYQHAQYDFRIDASVLAARPFYFDHTLYGACAVLLIGLLLANVPEALNISNLLKRFSSLQLILMLVCALSIFLSYSRAVWLSIIAAGMIVMLVKWYQYNTRQLTIAIAILLSSILLSLPLWQKQLLNNTVESKKGGLTEQLISITNITTDVSNLERINRYSCAWRMFLDRPLTGFGAGTFPQAYLPYQLPQQTTRISVFDTGPHLPGRGGSTHSEYLQALSEGGIISGLLWLSLPFLVLVTTLRISNKQKRWQAYWLFFGLSTYLVHALFNNFLHEGKFSAIFWCALALLSSLSNIDRQTK